MVKKWGQRSEEFPHLNLPSNQFTLKSFLVNKLISRNFWWNVKFTKKYRNKEIVKSNEKHRHWKILAYFSVKSFFMILDLSDLTSFFANKAQSLINLSKKQVHAKIKLFLNNCSTNLIFPLFSSMNYGNNLTKKGCLKGKGRLTNKAITFMA